MTKEELLERYIEGVRNFRGADLHCFDLHGTDFHGTDFHGADLSGADLRYADFSGADLSGVDLRGADMCDANLRDADLRDADLRDADLRGADLSGAVIDYVTEPLGAINWNAGERFDYVACLYGDDGAQPGDCRVRVGEDESGVWWLDDGDDTESALHGPYNDRESAEAAAKQLAEEQDEANTGEDAEDMAARLLDERAGEPDPEGEWCVYWNTVGDDSHVVERYATEDAASAAAQRSQAALEARHPGRLLCGYEVRYVSLANL
jgi:hypothetical protein